LTIKFYCGYRVVSTPGAERRRALNRKFSVKQLVVLIVLKIVAGPSIFKSKSCVLLIGRLFEIKTSFG
jgi:hypothetical protein